MTDQAHDFDVAIIGAGPTGMMAAIKLGQDGLRVCILEKRDEPYTTPRAIAYDAELLRSFQTMGVLEDMQSGMIHDLPVKYYNEKGKLLWSFSNCPSAFGFPSRGTYYQPALERGLVNGVDRLDTVDMRRGVEIDRLEQDDSGVTLFHAGGRLRARFVIACDGGSSQTRQSLGLSFEGRTFEQKWLVVDVTDDGDPNQDLQFFCNPKRPALSLPNADRRRRWEFQVMPGDDEADLLTEDRVRSLIADHGGGSGFGIERSLIYTFHARFASRFRVGRVLLAGDSAHVMPPFAGQGLCAGARDAVNLAWKLSGVCKGVFDPAILDTYEAERRPHVTTVTDFAVRLGGIIMTTNPIGAFLRDRFMNLIWAIPMTRNYIDTNDPIPTNKLRKSSLVRKGAHQRVGQLIEQPQVVHADGESSRLDDVMGRGFAMVGIGVDPAFALGPADKARLDRIGARLVALDTDDDQVRDPEGKLAQWLGTGHALVLVRPDRIIADVLEGEGDNRLNWLDRAYDLTLRSKDAEKDSALE